MQEETLKNVVEELFKNYKIEVEVSGSYGRVFYKGQTIEFEEDVNSFHNGDFKKFILLTLDQNLSDDERIKIRKQRYNSAVFAYNGDNILDFKKKADMILRASKFNLTDLYVFDQYLTDLVDNPDMIDEDDFVIPPAVSENYN